MNLAESIKLKSGEAVELTRSATSILWIETWENKRFLVKRPLPQLADALGFKACFKKEFELGQTLKHPNLLAYDEWEENAMQMERGNYLTLEQLFFENPSFITRTAEVERIISEILGAVNYLHSQGIYQYDLTPKTILLTKTGKNVKLAGAASYYTNLRMEVWNAPTDYAAPELREENACLNARTDIFAIGKVLEFIFAYTETSYKYSGIIKRATMVDPMRRYASIASMKSAIERRAAWQKTRRSLALIAAVGLLTGVGIWISNQATEEVEFVKPASNSTHTFDSIQHRVEEFAQQALGDSTLTDNEQRALQDSMNNKVNDIYKRQFRRRIEPIISRIYNKQMMGGTEANFHAAAMQGYEEVRKVQEELVQENKLDEASAAKIAAEVISEIAGQKMNDMK